MLSEYINAAMALAQISLLEDSSEPDDSPEFVGEIPGLQGVWSAAATMDGCRAELQSVLESWILLRLTRGLPIPSLSGIDLSVVAVG